MLCACVVAEGPGCQVYKVARSRSKSQFYYHTLKMRNVVALLLVGVVATGTSFTVYLKKHVVKYFCWWSVTASFNSAANSFHWIREWFKVSLNTSVYIYKERIVIIVSFRFYKCSDVDYSLTFFLIVLISISQFAFLVISARVYCLKRGQHNSFGETSTLPLVIIWHITKMIFVRMCFLCNALWVIW